MSTNKKEIYHEILTQWNSYYNELSEINKKQFLLRTIVFINSTKFDSTKGFELTTEMLVVISSAFVQITFGLKENALRIFNNIFVVPQPYSYRSEGPLYVGDVNMFTKKVNLSWPAVEKGFVVNNDGINLAIHEFAHCLMIENRHRSYIDKIFNESHLKIWKELAIAKIAYVRNGESSLFREYGGNNLMELFAITLEVFFEKPQEFYEKYPEFYIQTAKLLKQKRYNF